MLHNRYRVSAILTLLFVSSVIPGSPDSKRIIVREDIPALRASSSFRKPNRMRRLFHEFAFGIKTVEINVVTSLYIEGQNVTSQDTTNFAELFPFHFLAHFQSHP